MVYTTWYILEKKAMKPMYARRLLVLQKRPTRGLCRLCTAVVLVGGWTFRQRGGTRQSGWIASAYAVYHAVRDNSQNIRARVLYLKFGTTCARGSEQISRRKTALSTKKSFKLLLYSSNIYCLGVNK